MVYLAATRFVRTFASGHSNPCLIEAETLEGDRLELVLKLRGSVHGGSMGWARELVASQLATAIGVPTPTPFVVEVSPKFAESLPDSENRDRLRANVGLNFGSLFLRGQWHPTSFGARLPHRLFDKAALVFAFDALIGNDDRHFEKSNYLIRKDCIMVIDHERAFPFGGVGDAPLPWAAGGLDHLRKHAFFAGLRGQLPDFGPLARGLGELSLTQLEAFVAAVPAQWERGGVTSELRGYLMALLANWDKVLTELKTLL